MAQERASETACYVYGIVPADVEVDAEGRGIGDPPAKVGIIRRGEIAALVSRVNTGHPLGTPEDLGAHAHLLNSAVTEAPVLPLRFGAVMADEESVGEELLDAHHDEFVAALEELEGKAEYVIKGRYDQEEILREVLSESEEAARLRDAIRDKSEDASRDDRIALGEIVNSAITAKRDADTREVADKLEMLGLLVSVREPTHEEEAVHVSCLAETSRQDELEKAVEHLSQEWEGRIEIRLLGPVAPYDFVVTSQN